MGADQRADRETRLLLGGDAMLARGVSEWLDPREAGAPLAPLHSLTQSADLFAVNLECAISAHQEKFEGAPKVFYFRAIPKAVQTLRAAGVDLVSLANNHALDAGVKGLQDTLQHLEEAGIGVVGAGDSLSSAMRPLLVECQDLRLGFLSCCDHQSDFAAAPDRPGIWYLDLWSAEAEGELLEQVESLARATDLTVVSLHWQPNWAPLVRAPVRRLARQLVEAGADLIWGHSPHHFQGVEWLGEAVSLYATGDLVDDYAVDPHFRNDRQLLFQISVRKGEVQAVRARPLKLGFARTGPAAGDDWRWIKNRFAEICGRLGSHVGVAEEGWLEVLPN